MVLHRTRNALFRAGRLRRYEDQMVGLAAERGIAIVYISVLCGKQVYERLKASMSMLCRQSVSLLAFLKRRTKT